MKYDDLYALAARGDYEGARSAAVEAAMSGEQPGARSVQALALALLQKADEARRVLSSLPRPELNAVEAATCLEAEMVLAIHDGKDRGHAQQLAREAVALNPGAVFARQSLAVIAESQKRPEEALENYRAVVEAFPESQGPLFDSARILFSLRRRKEAMAYIVRAKPSLRRSIYGVIIGTGVASRVVGVLAVALLVLSPYTAAYGFWFVGTSGAMILVCGWRSRDRLVLALGLWVVVTSSLFAALGWLLAGFMAH
jgi:tetratricopeptide (TPR) repeat protein